MVEVNIQDFRCCEEERRKEGIEKYMKKNQHSGEILYERGYCTKIPEH